MLFKPITIFLQIVVVGRISSFKYTFSSDQKLLIKENLIASDEKMDSRHFNVFFATYRTFASPQQILPIFIRLYNTQKLDKISSNGCIQVAANSGQHMQPTHENGNSKTVMQKLIIEFSFPHFGSNMEV